MKKSYKLWSQILILLSMLVCNVAISATITRDILFQNPDFNIVLPKNSQLDNKKDYSKLDINEGNISFTQYNYTMPSGIAKSPPVPLVINVMSLTDSFKDKFKTVAGQREFLADFVNSQQSSIGIPVSKINDIYTHAYETNLNDKIFQTSSMTFKHAILTWYMYVSQNKLYTIFMLSPLDKQSLINEEVNKRILQSMEMK